MLLLKGDVRQFLNGKMKCQPIESFLRAVEQRKYHSFNHRERGTENESIAHRINSLSSILPKTHGNNGIVGEKI